MYSVVLMAALTTGAAGENCHWGCGCYGGNYGGCYGGCYGGYGYGGGYYGGCYGGCYGGGRYYGGGGYGGCYGGCYGGYAGYGAYGGWSCYGGGTYGPVVVPSGVPVNPGPGGAPEKLGEPKKQDETTRAKVMIDVPANAKLYIDDQPMSNKTGQRAFLTPPLVRGQTYFYDVKIVVTVDGREKAETQRVILRAGDVVAASFTTPQNNGTATAQADPR
jgi:uncharacterized protein (TIGR03000 family)